MTEQPTPRKRRSYQQAATKKRSTGLRLSEPAREMLAQLAAQLSISQTAVLELAIRRLAKDEGVK